MRARNLKPGLFKNEVLGAADPLLTLLFQGLWCIADREGLLEDRPLRIKAEVFPYRDVDVNGELTELERLGFIRRFQQGEVKLILVANFKKHQSPHHTEKKSIWCVTGPELEGCKVNGELTVESPLTHGGNPPDLLTPDSLIPDSLIPDSTTTTTDQEVENPSIQPPKRKRRSRSRVIEAFSGATRQVVNELLKIWPVVQPKDRSPIRLDVPMLAGRVDSLLREPGVTADLVLAAANLYLEQQKQFLHAPQFFLGPSNGKESPWLPYARMVAYQAQCQLEVAHVG
jgi:hypothetical protein